MISQTVPVLPQAISLTAESVIAGEERLSILLVNYNGMRYLGPCRSPSASMPPLEPR